MLHGARAHVGVVGGELHIEAAAEHVREFAGNGSVADEAEILALQLHAAVLRAGPQPARRGAHGRRAHVLQHEREPLGGREEEHDGELRDGTVAV